MQQFPPQPYFRIPKRPNSEAPLFVFLPGMDGTGQLLRVQTAGLEKAFDIRCLAIPPDDLTDWDELAESVVALIEVEINRKGRPLVYLCGESFGGCLALKVLLHAPHLFDYLLLVNPASSFNQNFWLQWGSHLILPAPEPVYKAASVAFLPFLASLERIEASDRRALLSAMQFVSPEAAIWRLELLRKFRVTPDQLSAIVQPALVVASGSDRLLPSVSEARRLVRHLKNAEMFVLPDSGHACLLEAEVNLNEIIQATSLFKQQAVIEAGIAEAELKS